jgi:hypothetical protein
VGHWNDARFGCVSQVGRMMFRSLAEIASSSSSGCQLIISVLTVLCGNFGLTSAGLQWINLPCTIEAGMVSILLSIYKGLPIL